ncbi:MAG: PHP domain-containing protein [Rhizobiales bacterium]|nr:PHP domain-containing protein [Hyphomicrobiales bacterium]
MLLSAFAAPGRFWRGNLHTHSTLSDGRLPPAEVCAAYRRAGYDFMQLSEHFLGRFDWPIADTRAFRSADFTTLIGAELHAPTTQVGELWHIVAAGLPLDFAPAREGEDAAALAWRAREAGAFVGVAHPAWSQLAIEDGRALDAAHAVEIYNHGCAIENDRGDGFYLLDQLLNEGRRLSAFATDDAHFTHGEQDAFGGWVHVKASALEPDLIVEALKRGDYYSSQGPTIESVALDGHMLTVACSPVNAISVMGGTSRSVTRVGHAIGGGAFDLRKLTQSWLPVQRASAWLRVAVIDAGGRRAWTNPFWPDEMG